MKREIILKDRKLIETWILGNSLAHKLFLNFHTVVQVDSLSEFLEFYADEIRNITVSHEIQTYIITGFFKQNNILYYKDYKNQKIYNLNFLTFNTVISCAMLSFLNSEYLKRNSISFI